MQLPDSFEVSPDFTYVQLGDFHTSRYDFVDESAPIFLVHGATERFAVIDFYTLHKIWRFERAIVESDDVMALSILKAFECEAWRMVRAYEAKQEAIAAEDEQEARWQGEHEAGLRSQGRYI